RRPDRRAPDDVRCCLLRSPPGRRRAGGHLPRAREGAPRGSRAASPGRLMADRYDLIVIGAGPGGYVCAIRAAQLGMRVACVDRRAAPGGTCLHIGCIPSKTLLESSELYVQARSQLGRHGIQVGDVYIGLELGSVWARLGAKVTVVESLPRILAQSDGEIAGLLHKSLVKQGLNIHVETKVIGASSQGGQVIVNAQEHGADQLFQ